MSCLGIHISSWRWEVEVFKADLDFGQLGSDGCGKRL